MTKQPLRFDPELPVDQPPGGWGHGGDLTLTLTLDERELLMRLLSGELTLRTSDRDQFNAIVQLRARIGGYL